MAPLTPADVKRWDADAIHSVFQTATNRATTLQTLGDNLQQVHTKLTDWQGEAGDAFRADLGKARHDIEADGHETSRIAAAVSRAEADVRAVKSELDGIEQAAQVDGFAITSDWRIDSGSAKLDSAKAAAKQQLQGQLDACKLHAHSADQELATAVRSAVGDMTAGSQPASDQPKTWQDMLLPTGAGSGDGAKGPPVPGDAARPPSLEDMMTGHGTPANQKPPTGDPLDLLSRVQPAPPPQLKPADVEAFKAMARQTMINDGVPPDQIEARLNAVVANTQQWLNAGAPNYVPPEPPKAAKPSFGEEFGNHWFATEDAIHSLLGQNGADAAGDAWGGMAKGLAGKAEEYLTMGPAAAIPDAVGEVKSFIDNPAGYLGGKTADVAMTAPFMMFGPEGAAARAGLGEGLGEMSGLDAASGLARDVPGIHPPIGPLEDLAPDLRTPLSSPEGSLHDGLLPSGPVEAPATGLFDSGPREGLLPADIHPSGPVEGPLSAGSASHPSLDSEVVAPAGNPHLEPPGAPPHSELPASAIHAPAEVPANAGHAPGSADAPVAGGRMPSLVEAHAPEGHVAPGLPESPVSGGHGSSGPPESPADGGHPSSGPIEHPPTGVVDHSQAPESRWAQLGHDQPITYHPEASQAALDLADAAAHGQPTAELSQRVADMSTHYVGDNPDRVVLGKWAGDDSGYIGDARGHGGIYYDTSSEVWTNIGHGLSEQAANDLGWEVNQNFLRTQMERGVERIDYVTEGTRFNSIADVLRLDKDSFSAKEIRYLIENAGDYGYERVGDSWIRVGGGQR